MFCFQVWREALKILDAKAKGIFGGAAYLKCLQRGRWCGVYAVTKCNVRLALRVSTYLAQEPQPMLSLWRNMYPQTLFSGGVPGLAAHRTML